jgi:CDP-diacylglycerol pyrophosphatase
MKSELRRTAPPACDLRWTRRLGRCLIRVAACFAILSSLADPGRASDDRNALWQVVQLCVRDQQTAGIPFPCRDVDIERGFALIKVGNAHFLLIPSTRIQGIESPELRALGAANYWEFAWEARTRLDEASGTRLSRDEVGLAVNSAQARTQDQLHIHVGCIRPDVRAALQIYATKIEGTWSRLPFAIGGHGYRIMRIEGDTLATANPFRLLADGIPAAHADMASQTLVVAGATFRDGRSGFYLLAEQSEKDIAASGESLLDYQCRY